MIYQFVYYSNGNSHIKTCFTEREAIVFFNILTSARISFSVKTINKRRK